MGIEMEKKLRGEWYAGQIGRETAIVGNGVVSGLVKETFLFARGGLVMGRCSSDGALMVVVVVVSVSMSLSMPMSRSTSTLMLMLVLVVCFDCPLPR